MQKITKKKIIAGVIVIAAIAIIFSLIRSCGKGKEDVFEYEECAVGTVQRTISVPGVVEVMDVYRVLSKATGIVIKVYADYNQEVKKGQVLATVDPTEINNRLIKMGSQLESVKIELAIAKEDVESKRSMLQDNLISPKAMERAVYNYKTTQNKYQQFMIDYNQLKTMKADTRIIAPMSGTIITKNIEENAPTGINSPVFVIAPNLKKMKLTVNIDESDIGQIKKGQTVNFTVSAYPDQNFRGTISQVRLSPIMKGSVVTYESLVVCENDKLLLKPGMTATATVEINKKEKVLKVSNQAFIVKPADVPEEKKNNIVWRKTAGLSGKLPVEPVAVEVGLRGDNTTEIKKNLKKGDKILIKFIKKAKK